MENKTTVYILKTLKQPHEYYTGLTSDLESRVAAHNAGRCTHTASRRPWVVVVSIHFSDERRAAAFEQYLKSGSGCSFSVRHFR